MTLSTLYAAGASFSVLFAVFVPLERAFAARRSQHVFRPEWLTDLAFFLGQYLLFGALAHAVLADVQALVARLTPALFGLPIVARLLLGVLLGDLCVYFFHRACHVIPALWRFHAVHHSVEHLDWLAAHREHPLDGLSTQLFQNLPAMLLGAPFEALAGLAVLRGAWGVFIHSNVRIPLGPLRLLLGAPELHHWHHARGEVNEHNFANLAPWIDVLFGTYHRPVGAERYAIGLSEPWPRSYLAQLAWPFVPTRWRAWLGRLERGPGSHEHAA